MVDPKDTPVISRLEADISGLKHYFTGRPCVQGHVAQRLTNDGACQACRKAQAAFWYSRNKALSKSRGHHWKKVVNPKRHKQWKQQYYKTNKDKFVSDTKAARMRRRRAMPPWADVKAIRKIYHDRARISLETGILHHVDHIIPLRGKDVCGLHVSCNLQIIPAAINQRKFNKFYDWDNMNLISQGRHIKVLDENSSLT